jgi:hypothetical protein
MALKEKKITSANLMASVLLRFQIGGSDGRRLGTRNTRRERGERRMKCHRHRNASRFSPLYYCILFVFYSFFFLSFGLCTAAAAAAAR